MVKVVSNQVGFMVAEYIFKGYINQLTKGYTFTSPELINNKIKQQA